MLPILDTHQHLWDLSRFDLPWVSDAGALNRSFHVSDYLEAVEGSNVVGTIYMEVDVTPAQRHDEAAFVSGLCADPDNPMRAVVVGGRPTNSDFADDVALYGDNPHVRGVRQILHGPDTPPQTCRQPDYLAGIRALGKAGLSFDLCLRPGEIADAVAVAEACPDTQLILDHCGNPDPYVIASDGMDDGDDPIPHSASQWRRDMEALGRKHNVVCKVSGIVARVTEGWTSQTLAPTVNHCLDCFGPDRVVFGGDWPVCTMGASYQDWAAALRQIIADRPQEEQLLLLHDNAMRIYKL